MFMPRFVGFKIRSAYAYINYTTQFCIHFPKRSFRLFQLLLFWLVCTYTPTHTHAHAHAHTHTHTHTHTRPHPRCAREHTHLRVHRSSLTGGRVRACPAHIRERGELTDCGCECCGCAHARLVSPPPRKRKYPGWRCTCGCSRARLVVPPPHSGWQVCAGCCVRDYARKCVRPCLPTQPACSLRAGVCALCSRITGGDGGWVVVRVGVRTSIVCASVSTHCLCTGVCAHNPGGKGGLADVRVGARTTEGAYVSSHSPCAGARAHITEGKVGLVVRVGVRVNTACAFVVSPHSSLCAGVRALYTHARGEQGAQVVVRISTVCAFVVCPHSSMCADVRVLWPRTPGGEGALVVVCVTVCALVSPHCFVLAYAPAPPERKVGWRMFVWVCAWLCAPLSPPTAATPSGGPLLLVWFGAMLVTDEGSHHERAELGRGWGQ